MRNHVDPRHAPIDLQEAIGDLQPLDFAILDLPCFRQRGHLAILDLSRFRQRGHLAMAGLQLLAEFFDLVFSA